jgi:hypothetical protein
MSTDPIWTENALADLRREFGDAYAGRTGARDRRRRFMART